MAKSGRRAVNDARMAAADELLNQAQYVKQLEGKPYEHEIEDIHGNTHYINQSNARTEGRYSEHVIESNYGKAYPLIIFYRLLNELGQRVFTEQDQLNRLRDKTDLAWLMNLGEKILEFDYKNNMEGSEPGDDPEADREAAELGLPPGATKRERDKARAKKKPAK